MPTPAFTLLAPLLAIAGLLATAALATRFPTPARYATAALCLLLLPVALWAIIAPPASLALPIGLPGAPTHLAIDPLAALFAIPILLLGAAASTDPVRSPLLLAATLLLLLAADAFTLLAAFAATAALGAATRRDFTLAFLQTLALLAALAFLALTALAFEPIRAAPPTGWRAAAILAFALLGPGARMAQGRTPGALPHLALAATGAYTLIRLLFDLCGPATPIAWGAPLLIAGAGAALLAARRATLEPTLATIAPAITAAAMGLAAIALGAALAARGADLPTLAATALGAALFLILAHALLRALLHHAGAAILHAAGTGRLDRLGGLIHTMPLTTATLLAAALSAAALPPSAAFAALWLLLQSLIAAPRIGDLALQLLFALAFAATAATAALLATATIRLVGIACLGRPRTPRAAAAADPAPPFRAILALLAALLTLLGLAPSPALNLALSAVQPFTGAEPTAIAYTPLAYLLLAALLAAALTLALRPTRPARSGPAWSGGDATPPPWLPFGDPLTQPTPDSFAQPIEAALPLPRWPTPPRRLPRSLHRLALALLALAAP